MTLHIFFILHTFGLLSLLCLFFFRYFPVCASWLGFSVLVTFKFDQAHIFCVFEIPLCKMCPLGDCLFTQLIALSQCVILVICAGRCYQWIWQLTRMRHRLFTLVQPSFDRSMLLSTGCGVRQSGPWVSRLSSCQLLGEGVTVLLA